MEFNSVLAQTHPLLRSSTRFFKLDLLFQRFARKRNYQHFLETVHQNDK